jgi:hypothetical protein
MLGAGWHGTCFFTDVPQLSPAERPRRDPRGVRPLALCALCRGFHRQLLTAPVCLLLACSGDAPLAVTETQRGNEPTNASPQFAAAIPAPQVPTSSSAHLQAPKLSALTRTELRRSLSKRLSRSLLGLETRVLGPAAQAVRTQGRFQHVVVQVRGADGQLRTECLDEPRQLDAVLGRESVP